MSEIEETNESEGYKCPYCGYMHTCDDWGYDYDGVGHKCDGCDKFFYATAQHNVDFVSGPDCELNGDEHKLSHFKDNAYFCDVCSQCVIK